MLNLKVNIDESSGFCFGVIYAIEMAEEVLEKKGKLYCLGDIVHNDEEVKRLQKKGLVIIDHEQYGKLQNQKVLIRAHGEPSSTYKIAMENNLELIDASCPVVLKLQNRIKSAFDSNAEVYIYGKKDHAEVKGLVGQTGGQARVFSSGKELVTEDIPEEITLFSQTTKSRDEYYRIRKTLENKGKKVSFHDTICRQVSNRDQELKEFSRRYNKIIFVAGKRSSNGRNLYESCYRENPYSYFVSTSSEIKKDWFEENDTVGICGATSTPMWLMEEVKNMVELF